MKKLFFASALVAGLGMLASCSNDDVVAVNGGAPGIAENGLVPVELGISGPSVSVQKRGIGTVGDITGEAGNVWKGESLNLLMLQRSEAESAPDAGDAVTWDFSQWSYTPDGGGPEVTVVNFANVAVTTPTDAAAGALSWASETTPKYYPNEGTHDFFAYHIDDAATIYKNAAADTDGTPNADFMVRDSTVAPDASPSIKYVWFKIDGSQDLMAGLAENMEGEPDAQTNAGFSAQTARAGVKPNINMQHLLTRFTFTVLGADDSAQGIEVEKITVKSKTTGKMIVAYDLGQGKQAPENLISFELPVDAVSNPDGTTAEEPVALELKDRAAANTAVAPLTPEVIAGVDEDGDKTGYVFTPQPIGHALMVAPGESEYEMSITLKQTYVVDNDQYPDPNPHPVGSTTLTHNIVIPSAVVAPDTPTEDTVAQPGSSYAVNVKVYGMAKIEVDATLQGWKDGGDIEIDTNAPAGGAEEDPEP